MRNLVFFLYLGISIGINAQSNNRIELNGLWKVLPAFDGTSKHGKARISAEVLTGVAEVPDNPAYKEENFDDRKWQTVDDLSQFKYSYTDGTIGFSRYIWLRKSFFLGDSLKSLIHNTGSISLYFKGIDAPDCYLNGKAVGGNIYDPDNSGIEYLIKADLIKWNGMNNISFRVRYYGSFNMKTTPYFGSSSPYKLFTFENQKENPSDCYIRNSSQKEVSGEVTVNYTGFDKKTIKKEIVNVSLKSGLTKVESLFPATNSFVNGNYELFIREYQIKMEWNISTGINPIVYQPKANLFSPKVTPRFESLALYDQNLSGLLGVRMARNTEARLLKVDVPELIGGYLNQPGVHPWIGEHAGKFLDAACFSYENKKNDSLKLIMDKVAQNLIASQKEDGYLGTYVFEKRWTSWDVWSLKYNLIGLMHYYETSGFEPALNACIKMGDLICKTFGNKSGQLDLIKAGGHVGMASTSVMEPMVDLYGWTGDTKYIDFCKYILESYNQQNGPKIIKTLKETGRVDKVANGKAYEMLSNLVGILKLYKATGDKELFDLMQTAWNDIVTNRLYITGASSNFEVFHDNHDLSANADDHMGEGCVTTTWVQFNYQLFLLTGEIKYLNELERVTYNHLTGAENPQTGGVSYYTSLTGIKPYRTVITCCMSSIPRGISMIPLFTEGKIENNPTILLYEPGEFKTIVGKTAVSFSLETRFPLESTVKLTVNPVKPLKFKLNLRVPYWATDFTVLVNNKKQTFKTSDLTSLERVWKKGDKVEIRFEMPVKILEGGVSYPGFVAIQRGPQVLVFDQSLNKVDAGKLTINPENLQIKPLKGVLPQGWVGSQAYQVDAFDNGNPVKITLVPFGDASQSGGFVTTWLKKK
jgi:DUF1680 family protein